MANPATVTFKCACGQGMKAKAEFAGRKTACPKCKKPVAIPRPHVSVPNRSPARPSTAARAQGVQPGRQTPNPGGFPGGAGGPGMGMSAPAGFPGSAPAQASPTLGSPTLGSPAQGAPPSGSIPPVAAGFPGQVPAAGHAPPGMMPPQVGPPGNIPPVAGYSHPGPPQQANNSMAADTCPSCGSFFPRAQPNCAKCRYSRALGKKIPYQSMAQPVARMQAPPPKPKRKSADSERFGMQIMYVIGGLVVTVVGFGLGALMVAGAMNSESGRIRGKAFVLPAVIIAAGFGMMSKGITGNA